MKKMILALTLILSSTAWAKSANQVYVMPASGNIPGWAQLDLSQSAAVKNQLPPANGGLGIASITAHNLIIGNGTSAATLLAPGTSGFALISNGASADPSWASIVTNPMTTLGDGIYGGASGIPTRLAGDTSNTRKFLTETASSGAAQAPAWGFQRSIQTKTGTYSLLLGDDTVFFNISSAANATLPSASGVTNQSYFIRNLSSSAASLSLLTTSSQTVDGRSSGSVILSPTDWIQVVSDGSNWQIISEQESVSALYYLSANSSANHINFDTKINDNHNSVTTGVGTFVFTAPYKGNYLFTTTIISTGTGGAQLWLNGVFFVDLWSILNNAGSPAININLSAGDTVFIDNANGQPITGGSPPSSANVSMFSVSRTGN